MSNAQKMMSIESRRVRDAENFRKQLQGYSYSLPIHLVLHTLVWILSYIINIEKEKTRSDNHG